MSGVEHNKRYVSGWTSRVGAECKTQVPGELTCLLPCQRLRRSLAHPAPHSLYSSLSSFIQTLVSVCNDNNFLYNYDLLFSSFIFQKMLGEGRFVFVNGKTLSSTNSGHCYESSDSHLYQNTPVAETDVRQLYLYLFILSLKILSFPCALSQDIITRTTHSGQAVNSPFS